MSLGGDDGSRLEKSWHVLAVGSPSNGGALVDMIDTAFIQKVDIDFATKVEATQVLGTGSSNYEILVIDNQIKGPGMEAVIQAARAGAVEQIVVVGGTRRLTERLGAVLLGADAYVAKADVGLFDAYKRREGIPDEYLQQLLQASFVWFPDDLASTIHTRLRSLFTGSEKAPADVSTAIQMVVGGLSPEEVGVPQPSLQYQRVLSQVEASVESAIKEALWLSGPMTSKQLVQPTPVDHDPDAARRASSRRPEVIPEDEATQGRTYGGGLSNDEGYEPGGGNAPWSEVIVEVAPDGGGHAEPGGSRKPAEDLPAEDRPAEDLFWNTDFPDDKGILRNEPHIVAVGGEYPFSTALAARPGSSGLSTAVAPKEVVGREVVFALTATGGQFLTEGSTEWQTHVESESIRCSETGAGPFRVIYKAGAAGSATIDASLVVRNGTIASERIDLLIAGQRAPAPDPEAPDRSKKLHAGCFNAAEETPLRLLLDIANADATLHVHGDPVLGHGRPPNPDSLAALYAKAYVELRKLSNAETNQPMGDGFKIDDPDGARLALARIGARLHDAIFMRPVGGARDPIMKQFADYIKERPLGGGPALFEIQAAEYPVPWGLLYDRSSNGGQDLKTAIDVKNEGFWGNRFDIRRSRARMPGPVPWRGSRRRMKPVVAEEAPGGTSNAAFIRALGRGHFDALLDVEATCTTSVALREWVRTDADIDLLYLFCHARPARTIDDGGGFGSVTDPLASALGLGVTDTSGETLELCDLLDDWPRPRRTHPVVFLNACSSGHLDVTYGAPFVDFFVDEWEAQAFVGTDWPVSGPFADRFGRRVLRCLLEEKKSLREALRAATDESFLAGNPFPVLYAVYGTSSVRFAESGS